MRSKGPSLTALAILLPLAWPGIAGAVVLGEVTSVSPLGAPFRVELRSLDGRVNDAGECLRVANDEGSELPSVRNVRISATGSGASARIIVSSAAAVNEPAVQLTLQNICDSRLQRRYTLLLPFPDQAADAPQRPTASAVQSSPVPQQTTPGPGRRIATHAAGGEHWTTAPGESLASLAEALHPQDRAAQRRFIAATARANPGLFPNADSHSQELPPGTDLLIPSPAQQARASRNASEQALAPASPDAPSRQRPVQASEPGRGPTSPARGRNDRLVVGEQEAANPRNYSAEPDSPGWARREQALTGAVDRTIVAQMELLARIKELEEMQAQLSARAARLGIALPSELQPPAASPPPGPLSPPPEETPPAAEDPPAPAVIEESPTPAAEEDPPDTQTATTAPATPEATLPAPPAADGADDDSAWQIPALLVALAILLVLLFLRQREKRLEVFPATTKAAFSEVPPSLPPEAPATELAPAPQPLTHISGVAPLDWDGSPVSQAERRAVAPLEPEDENVEEHDSAIELAEIMMSFGRVHGAAETLAEFIRSNPKQAVTPWLKLLEVYRAAGLRSEFDGLARQLNKTFNVKAVTWDNFDQARRATATLEQMPHIISALQATWGTREAQAYLQTLLRDNRDGTREGFPLNVIDDILTLAAILEMELGPYRPTPEETDAAA